MIEIITQQLIEWVDTLPIFYVYLVFFLVAYIENLIPPMPGDLLVAFGGYMAARGAVEIVLVHLLTTIASVIGFMNVYALGHYWGGQIIKQREDFWMLRFIRLKYISKVRRWMKRWGLGVVLANRFLAGMRSVISLTAGVSHTNIKYTVLASFISSVLWNAILLGAGWIVEKNWRIIGHYLSVYGWIVLGAVALFIVIRLLKAYYSRKVLNDGR